MDVLKYQMSEADYFKGLNKKQIENLEVIADYLVNGDESFECL